MSIGVEIAGISSAVSVAIQSKVAQVMRSVDGVAVNIVAGGARGPARNAFIASVQAIMKRSPWFIKRASDTMTAIRFVARGLASSDYGTRKQAVTQIGALMLEAVMSNVTGQRNANGSAFAPLSKNYAAFKRRKFGFVIPILKATGDLLGGLRVRVDRLR